MHVPSFELKLDRKFKWDYLLERLRWWCKGQHGCLPSNRSGFDSRLSHIALVFMNCSVISNVVQRPPKQTPLHRLILEFAFLLAALRLAVLLKNRRMKWTTGRNWSERLWDNTQIGFYVFLYFLNFSNMTRTRVVRAHRSSTDLGRASQTRGLATVIVADWYLLPLDLSSWCTYQNYSTLSDWDLMSSCYKRACGAMDNASDYGSEDSRFDSW